MTLLLTANVSETLNIAILNKNVLFYNVLLYLNIPNTIQQGNCNP